MNWEIKQAGTDEWHVEAIGDDGECYVTIFAGPDAQLRAVYYAQAMNGK